MFSLLNLDRNVKLKKGVMAKETLAAKIAEGDCMEAVSRAYKLYRQHSALDESKTLVNLDWVKCKKIKKSTTSF